MPLSQHAIIFYFLFSAGRIFFWMVRASGFGRSMHLLLLTFLVVSLSCAHSDGQSVLAAMDASLSLPAFIAAVAGVLIYQ